MFTNKRIESLKRDEHTRQDKSPVFRRAIIPWYDSDRACWIVILVGVAAGFFGVVGIGVAQETEAFSAHLWLPAVLTILSAAVVVSTLVRLIRRRKGDPSL